MQVYSNFWSKYAQAPWMFTVLFRNLFMFFSTKENSSKGNFFKFCKAGSGSAFKMQLDPDLHWEKMPDPQKMNADPQLWFWKVSKHMTSFRYVFKPIYTTVTVRIRINKIIFNTQFDLFHEEAILYFRCRFLTKFDINQPTLLYSVHCTVYSI